MYYKIIITRSLVLKTEKELDKETILNRIQYDTEQIKDEMLDFKIEEYNEKGLMTKEIK